MLENGISHQLNDIGGGLELIQIFIVGHVVVLLFYVYYMYGLLL